jgi:hypothetical protein
MSKVDTDVKITMRIVLDFEEVKEMYDALLAEGDPEAWIRLIIENETDYDEPIGTSVTGYLQGPDGQESIVFDREEIDG